MDLISSKNIEKVLRNYGLNDKEVVVYVNLLPLGSAPSSVIGKRCGMARSTAKFVCDQLVKKGLVEGCIKGKSIYYSALPPQQLIILLIEKQKKLNDTKIGLKSIMDTLMSMQDPATFLPKVKYYTTLDEISTLLKTIANRIEMGGNLYSFANILDFDTTPKKVVNLLNKYGKSLFERKIFNHVIAPDTEAARLFKKFDEEHNRETRLVNMDLKYLAGEIFLTKGYVYAMYLEGEDLFGISVKSNVIHEICQVLFDMAWQTAENGNKLDK